MLKLFPEFLVLLLPTGSKRTFPFGAKALHPGPRFDQDVAHRKMLITHQIPSSGLFDHCIGKESPSLVIHQSLSIPGEDRLIKHLFRQVHIQKPSEKKIVFPVLTKLPLTSNRIKGNRQESDYPHP
jgi:hypothetical protein